MQWQAVRERDGSGLVVKRFGACFSDLFVIDGGLFVYFRDHLVLRCYAVCCEADGRSMLYVDEDE
jgi:hypothetical protein